LERLFFFQVIKPLSFGGVMDLPSPLMLSDKIFHITLGTDTVSIEG